MTETNEQGQGSAHTQAASPGARLRAGRERKGLSLVEAADALRLDPALVEALERDDFAALGAPVFAKGHLRKYAALTGEPIDDLLLAYHQRAGSQDVPPPLLHRSGIVHAAERPPSGVPVAALLSGLVLVGAAGVWWWYEQPVQTPAPIGSSATSGALAAASIEPSAVDAAPQDQWVAAPGASFPVDNGQPGASPAQPSSADASAPANTPSVNPTLSPTASTTAANGAGAAPAAPAPTPPAATTSPSSAGVATAATSPQGAAPKAGEHSLVLSFTGDSWVEVQDAGGERLYYGIGVSGSRHTLRGQPPFEVFLGRYAEVSVELDGHARAIPADAIRGNTARFTLDPT